MDIWKEFDEKSDCMINNCRNKEVYIWGYGASGWFVEHLLKRYGITEIKAIDKNPNIKAYRPYYIRFIKPSESVLLLTFIPSKYDEQWLGQLGFKKDVNYIVIKELYDMDGKGFISYERYLDCKYGTDITTIVKKTERPSEDSCGYHWGMDYVIMDMLSKCKISVDDTVFDYGCGKGGALLLFNKVGCRKLGGVEYDKRVYNSLIKNMKRLGIDISGFILGDATLIKKEIDSYNCFFFYDPFEGKSFTDVLDNICESYERYKRKVRIIYASPRCHRYVIESGFKLIEHMDVPEMTYPNINAYEKNPE